ncbi:toll/interleukin-1 receptor domain-containing protein [Psychroserpens algicola]|uniref:Toll/interleukin-1 receptor domain-containing protein n=1 Tax=Psychroserpens algicola TaxID=1719034 RepID=A0ABT0H3W5_9FLAO|nr:toll/interleukin-1 receptor domain-containing protein [Psychroserpens algicola]MCK8479073.1 toll/interleukin-1 receptor domain-containing protein [Psychroserpens algicola]
MTGINRAHSLNISKAKTNLLAGVKCVFISHHKSDLEYCKKVASYIMKAGIDVYLDEYDYDLKHHVQVNNPKGVVNCIRKGINNSSHMLCVISPSTIYSKWVPWEIGYGYDKTKIGALTLKGITSTSLPDYIKTVPIVRGTKSLNSYLSRIIDSTEYSMESYGYITSHTKLNHPLDNVLDWKL